MRNCRERVQFDADKLKMYATRRASTPEKRADIKLSHIGHRCSSYERHIPGKIAPFYVFTFFSVRACTFFIMKVVRSIPRMAIYTTNCDISQLLRKHSSRSGSVYYPADEILARR